MLNTTVHFKPGVIVDRMSERIWFAIQQAALVSHYPEITVTSGTEGTHMVNSLHYKGLAVDLRIAGVSNPLLWMQDTATKIGKDYDCVLESDHIHIEYQPK